METANIRRSSFVEGPRWAGLRQALVVFADRCNLELQIDGMERGLIRYTIYFTVVGSEDNIKSFNTQLSRALADYNK